jgi:hypothetical protein
MISYRLPEPSDKKTLDAWISQDPHHKATCNSDFWLSSEEPRYETFVVEDEHGPVFFVRAEVCSRLHLQFCPQNGHDAARTKKALDQFCESLKGSMPSRFKQIIIESVYKPLVWYLLKRGMKRSPNELVFDL